MAGTLPRTYQYDANGNVISLNDDQGQRDYGYDGLDRLDTANLPLVNLGYSYDANGNRLSLTDNTTPTNLSYQANSNRLTQVGAQTVSLDAAGNTLSDQGGNRTFEYNQAGRISRVLIGGSEVARYEYDSNGLRIKKVTPNETTLYQYGLSGQLMAEAETNGILFREQLYADNELVAVIARDRGAPVITVPEDIVIEATDVLTPVDLGAASATDEAGVSIDVVPDSTGPFPLGQTTVIWRATDSQGRSNLETQIVTVIDTTSPSIVPPNNITLDTAIAPTPIAIGNAIATDIFGVTVSNNAPAEFLFGTTIVTWVAVDSNGNSSSADQLITVNSTNPACLNPSNVASFGLASQSSEHSSGDYPASLAINGITTDFTHTSSDDSETWWQLDFSELYLFKQVTLHNRDNCCEDRLRDIFVSVENDLGEEVYKSSLLNPENSLNSPATIPVDIPPLINGYKVKVERVPDPDFSGGGTVSILSLGEVVVQGCVVAPTPPVVVKPLTQGAFIGENVSLQIEVSDLNGEPLTYSATGLPTGISIDSQTGLISGSPTTAGIHTVDVSVSDGVFNETVSFMFTTADVADQCTAPTNLAPSGTATQSSTHTTYGAEKGNNGILTDFTHTAGDDPASWEVTLPQLSQVEQIVIHNRDSCCQDRLRDIQVLVEDDVGATIYESALLNPEDILSGPATITVDLPPLIQGSKVRVRREPDPDLSGGGTIATLSLGEVIVQGCDVIQQGGQ